jgi:ElaB/YqjD/DUF883 family membrane-anchored ribosome-binding protein
MSRNPLESNTNDPERVANFGERGTDNTEKVKDKLEDVTAKAKVKAEQWTESASETVDRQRENVSSGLNKAASTLHEKATNIPGGPRAVSAVHRFADGMETTASYLREHDFADIRDDLISLCKRHPVQALVSAVAFGFLLGRSVRR